MPPVTLEAPSEEPIMPSEEPIIPSEGLIMPSEEPKVAGAKPETPAGCMAELVNSPSSLPAPAAPSSNESSAPPCEGDATLRSSLNGL